VTAGARTPKPQPRRADDELEGKMRAEFERKVRDNWHTWVTQFWSEVHQPHGTVEEQTARLAAIYAEQKGKPLSAWHPPRHMLRKLALDLMCANFPEGHPPPDALVALMRRALDLPEEHVVGAWPLFAGTWDDRGDPDHEARSAAMQIDLEYIEEHAGHHMPLRELHRRLRDKLGRETDRKTLRAWRKQGAYWLGLWHSPDEPEAVEKNEKLAAQYIADVGGLLTDAGRAALRRDERGGGK
jgi:hypothetical protein